MRTVIPALLLALALGLLGLGLARLWRDTRGILNRTVELGPVNSGLLPLLAWGALIVLVVAGGIVRVTLP